MGGFFGTVSQQPCAADLFYGTDYQSHLGTRRGGMATYSSENGFFRSIHNLESTYFRTRFESEIEKFQGNSGIGVISDTDAQPMLMNSHLGRFALVTVAKINNMEELAQQLLSENMHLSEFSSGRINPTELVALLIIKGKDFVSGIENVYHNIKGSCSMLLLTEDGIIAARDSWGRTPIVVGRKQGAMAVTSESTAFPNLEYETCHFVGPGEIIRITSDSMEQLRKPNKRMQVCSFLWVYYGFPTSNYEGKNVEVVRNECGRVMGREDKTEVDCACGIPDSGIGMAVGYAEGHGVPYMRAISKYTPTWPRSFMPFNQDMRRLVAKMKLIANKDILLDKRVLFCDDSIVRGTQLRDNTKALHDLGAKEVHMRIACPPLVYGCPFINFSASKSELELVTRRIIQDFEGENPQNISAYTVTDSLVMDWDA
ncbi:MAG: amidophosphoribosyltransferase [Bacteroidaceae bacterium]|nr:amidophosphoribosyltransferase [Bacteroidaceae bacterium]